MDNQYYIEVKTGRRVKAEKIVFFDNIGWIVDYLDEPPVRYAYSDDEFKRQFMKEKKMGKIKFTKEAAHIVDAITLYNSLAQSAMLTDEVLIENDADGELKEIIKEIRNDVNAHMGQLNKFIVANATFEA